MDLSLFQLPNLVLIALLLFLLMRFLWMIITDPVNHPPSWKEARRANAVPGQLARLERFYADKVRFFTWWIQVDRLRRDHVPGAFAELGVYKGESARLLHLMDPTRTFYLLDTFEGFPESDLLGEQGKAATYTSRNFADTSVGKVLRKVNGNENIAIIQGYFPHSASSLKEIGFALVNIDADLYKPTKAGLEFFYPRVNPGGVLFIHDYNEKWPGVIRAVDEFTKSIPEIPMLVPDREGTIMILKSAGLRAQGD